MGTATPLVAIANHSGTPNWPVVEALINKWQPKALVVGVPLTLDGSEQPSTHAARGFIKQCKRRFALSVYEADERMSTMAANERIRQMRRSGQRKRKTTKADVDTLAAALILEHWFSQNHEQSPPQI